LQLNYTYVKSIAENEQDLIKMLRMFIADMLKYANQLESAMLENNREKQRKAIHSMRSPLLIFMLNSIEIQCETIEKSFDSKVEVSTNKLKEILENVSQAVKEAETDLAKLTA
jgi:HPt (histidine-containing phosphotransfer) domain-containing protein